MKKLAAIGSNEFILGFQLAGIRKTIELDPVNNQKADISSKNIKELVKEEDIGIVIMDENLLDAMSFFDRSDIENSLTPVFIPLSTKAAQENLRKLIKKSIGVDVWKQDESS
jgi:V/A-type H+/Na+-transporting ATPase subunit F